MTYPGGEEAFVAKMIEDSVEVVKHKVHWYTTMVGKKSTMKSMRALLYKKGVKVVRTTEFSQGKTLRWGLAWSLAAKEETNRVALRRGGVD
jgi:23S rRNA (adenine1618-N6)-methyltransferase